MTTMRITRILVVVLACGVVSASALSAAERPMMQSRVPADKLAEARALASPLPNSAEIIEKGKALYNGKGTCFNCHGKDGSGNGMAAVGLDPSPRNFQHHGFWRHRTEGEIYWVIKHGSPGTAMIGFGDQLSDEEIWSIIQYERSFAGEHGPGMMGHREGMGSGMGPGGGMGGMEHRGPRGEMGGCEGEACSR
jgi:mono/diheme cytochrome c family protein